MNLTSFDRLANGVIENRSVMKLRAYLSDKSNILEYKLRYGGDDLTNLCVRKPCDPDELKKQRARGEILCALEEAKADWKFAAGLLTEATDVDLIDYVIYLAKASEAKYRYLLKVARRENLCSEMWREKSS